MGKRSEFERNPRDYYPTPLKAVQPLVPHLPQEFTYAEPCAGDGRLVSHIKTLINGSDCLIKSDIEPQAPDIIKASAFNQNYDQVSLIITNPPWARPILHDMIEYFSRQAPTWLLFDLDWCATDQSEPFMKYCEKIVVVGRVKWIEGSKKTGKDNCAWYLFDQSFDGETTFHSKTLIK